MKYPKYDTYIFMVPLGPKLVFKTSWRPKAAEMLICKACPLLATSEFGLINFTAAEALFLLQEHKNI